MNYARLFDSSISFSSSLESNGIILTEGSESYQHAAVCLTRTFASKICHPQNGRRKRGRKERGLLETKD